jgi:serine/threonine protein phosphatase PrpC
MKKTSLVALGLLVSASSIYCLELQWGAAWRQGIRPEMQDAHIVNLEQSNNGRLFGIFDGHGHCCQAPCKHNGGLIVAQLVSDYVNAYSYSSPLNTVLRNAEKTLQNKSVAECAGTTALLARIKDDALQVNWVGDSRILVFDKKGTIKFESKDHTWWNKQEEARAKKLGVPIIENPIGIRRVAGMMPSRTLGDFKAKDLARGAIIAESQQAKVPLKSGDVIIMACDGLWDVFTAQEVIEYYSDLVMYEIAPLLPNREEGDAEGALAPKAWQLRDAAYRLDSTDNISVIVIEVN